MIELNKIYNENCLETMKRMEDNFVDLTVTSPPYDNLRQYNGYSFDFENVAKELFRVTKQGGVVVWVVGDATVKGSESGTSFKQALYFKEIGFNLHDTMIYAKNSYMPLTHNRYEQQFEYMFVLSKGKPKTFNPIMIPSLTAGTKRNRGSSKANEKTYAERLREEKTTVNSEKQKPNIWFYDVGKNDKTKHNAPFPEQLAQDHILSWSNENDLVYDPFMGSGTTAKMSILNNRNWVGSEISSEYCKIIEERVKKAREEKRKEKDLQAQTLFNELD
ncbi:MAG TPA: site-specific DNA-methyltransferase [archaeon]|nr:site-specific DNA-methyltransferase [archaeon]